MLPMSACIKAVIWISRLLYVFVIGARLSPWWFCFARITELDELCVELYNASLPRVLCCVLGKNKAEKWAKRKRHHHNKCAIGAIVQDSTFDLVDSCVGRLINMLCCNYKQIGFAFLLLGRLWKTSSTIVFGFMMPRRRRRAWNEIAHLKS